METRLRQIDQAVNTVMKNPQRTRKVIFRTTHERTEMEKYVQEHHTEIVTRELTLGTNTRITKRFPKIPSHFYKNDVCGLHPCIFKSYPKVYAGVATTLQVIHINKLLQTLYKCTELSDAIIRHVVFQYIN